MQLSMVGPESELWELSLLSILEKKKTKKNTLKVLSVT